MNLWQFIALIAKTYWWAWAMVGATGLMAHITENCPGLLDKLLGAAEKVFHIEINMDDEF